MEKSDHFQIKETLRDAEISNEIEVVEERRAQLKLVENPPTFVEALAANGIHDRGTLVGMRIDDFKATEFPPYGKGCAFAGNVLGSSFYNITKDVLYRIADELDLPFVADERFSQFKEALAVNGVTDRLSLIALGPSAFNKSDHDFPPFGKGRMFYSTMFGASVQYLKMAHLHQIADALGFPKTTIDDYKQVLYRNGIPDGCSLMGIDLDKFFEGELAPFKSGRTFVWAVLGRPLKKFGISDSRELCKKLDLPQIAPARKQEFRTALSANGISDRSSLMSVDICDFMTMAFPPYGKGQAFVSAVFGRSVRIKKCVLKELADKLDLPLVAGERLKQFKRALLRYGVKDRATLLAMGSSVFTRKGNIFPPFGKGFAFYKALFGCSIHYLTESHLHEIANALGYPKISIDDYRAALGRYGVTDRLGLTHMCNRDFAKVNWKPFGKGKAFAGSVLGISGFRNITPAILHVIADKLELPQISKASLRSFAKVLFELGIYDRKTFREMKLSEIKDLKFYPYGKIQAFASLVLDDTGIQAVTRDHIERIATRLRLSENVGDKTSKIHYTDVYSYKPQGLRQGDENFEAALAGLEHYEIYERKDLLSVDLEWFTMRNFKGFGIGIDFASIVLGRRIDRLTVSDLGEIADRFDFIDYGDFHYEESERQGYMYPSEK